MTYWQIIKYDNIVNHIYQDIKRYAVKVSELSDIVEKIGGSTRRFKNCFENNHFKGE